MTERNDKKSDVERLQDLQEHIGAIRHQLLIGKSAGDGEPVSGLDTLMRSLKLEIRKAAEANATRQATQAVEAAKELQKSPEDRDETPEEPLRPDPMQLLEDIIHTVPRHPVGNGDNPDPGGENGEGGGPGEKCDCCCCCAAATASALAVAIAVGGGGGGGAGAGGKKGSSKKLPDASCVYVRGETAIWGWSRFAHEWRVHDFGEPIIAVESGANAFLTLSKTGAIIFDCALGEFLTPLVASQAVKEGKIT